VVAYLDAGPTGPPGKCQAAQSAPAHSLTRPARDTQRISAD